MKWLRFILSHSVFISVCALALCYQSFELLGIPVNYFVYGLIFFSTLASYNFYWLISKYYFDQSASIKDFLVKNLSNLVFFILASIGIAWCLVALPGVLKYVIVASLLTLLYSVPLWPVKALAFTRSAGFLKTTLLAFTWTYVTVMIPAYDITVYNRLSLELLFTARFLFMLMLCIIFDTRDIHIDQIHALRSLATDVSRKQLHSIMTVAFLLYIICGFLLRYYFSDTAQVIAFFVTGLATWFVYRQSQQKQGYLFYYFVVDGLMLFSALATFIATI